MTLRLNVAAVRRHTRVNGPGLRAAVWVQGCALRCPGCFSPATHAHRARHLVDPTALAGELASDPDVAGLTVLGGEPFEQAEASAELVHAFRAARPELTVLGYSGYELACLQGSPHVGVQSILTGLDAIITGPYVAHLREPHARLWGSSNQRATPLTGRISSAELEGWAPPASVELSLSATSLSWTGQLAPVDARVLRRSRGQRASAPEA